MQKENLIIDWLLCAEPWTEYRTRLDLLNQTNDNEEVILSKKKLLNNILIQNLFQELSFISTKVVNSHKKADLPFHILTFLADLGFTKEDYRIQKIAENIFEHISDENVFQTLMNIPKHFGGTGEDSFAWAICDAPNLVYGLSKMGYANDERVIKAKNYLKNLSRQNGFPCAVSKELGKFRGPGKKDDPCPYATLIMLKVLSLNEIDKNSIEAKNSINALLNLWEQSKIQHPYMFFMGNDFRKLKVPQIWYDIVNVVDTLSNFEFIHNDLRFLDMFGTIEKKANEDGKFIPESIYTTWKNWDFGQKKSPSSWLTFLIYRIKKRIYFEKIV